MFFTRSLPILFVACVLFACQRDPAKQDVATSSMEINEEKDAETTAEEADTSANRLPILPTLGLGNPQPKAHAVEGYEKLTWEILRDVSFEDKYYEKEDEYFLYPTYGDQVQSYKGKDVFISGYLLPINPDSNIYVLSANTFSSCYFCGNAGPESIVELDLAEELGEGYITDQWIAFKGEFSLNADNLDHLYYILEDAVEVPLEE